MTRSASEDFLLIVSALVPYKRIDLAIEASRLSETPLRIIGEDQSVTALTRAGRAHGADVQLLGSLPTRRCAITIGARPR